LLTNIKNEPYVSIMINKNLNIPKIFIGTWPLAGEYWGEQSHSDSLKTLHACIRENFKSFDTSPDYGKGKSEQLLGQLKNRDLYISTKCFTKPVNSVKKSINNSLKRLNTDNLDIFFIHWPSTKYSFMPIMELLLEYKENKIIKNIGVSNFNIEQLDEIGSIGKIDIVQNAYNFLWTDDTAYFKYCKEKNIVTQAYSPLAQGLLTGKFTQESPFKPKDHRNKMVLFSEENLKIIYRYISILNEISKRENIQLSALILAWTLSKEFIDSIVVGCRQRYQVELLKVVENLTLDQSIIDELENISEEISVRLKKANNIFNHAY